MGYEARMQADILTLLQMFSSHVPDKETNGWVMELANDQKKWTNAHRVFDKIRKRSLIRCSDHLRACQYCFEEVCLQTFYNETCASDPFDSCSPYWVIKNALKLARALGIPTQNVVDIVAPSE